MSKIVVSGELKKTPVHLIACGMMREEMEVVFEGFAAAGRPVPAGVTYLDPALHVRLERLEAALDDSFRQLVPVCGRGRVQAVYGRLCHPDLPDLVARHGGTPPAVDNCFGYLLGPEKKRLEAEASTYFLTTGWLARWEKIFRVDHGWDEVDARLNLGLFERIVLIDDGLHPYGDEDILAFFDYAQVPIEIVPANLEHLAKSLLTLLEPAESEPGQAAV